jgi:transcriptional regulator with XRE-family HTH domain
LYYVIDMTKRSIGRTSLSAPARSALAQLGADLALARARRSLSLRDAAARLFVSVNTLRHLEAGKPGVGLGVLTNALMLYGMLDRLRTLADPAEDSVGLSLERRRLLLRGRPRETTFDV